CEEAVASFLRVGGEKAGKIRRAKCGASVQKRLLELLRHAAAFAAREREPVEQLRYVRLVESGSEVDHVAEMFGGEFAIAGVAVRSGGILPGAFFGEPKGHGEVRVSDERGEVVFFAGGENAAIVAELGVGKLTFCGLDAGPLDGKAVSVEAKIGEQSD